MTSKRQIASKLLSGNGSWRAVPETSAMRESTLSAASTDRSTPTYRSTLPRSEGASQADEQSTSSKCKRAQGRLSAHSRTRPRKGTFALLAAAARSSFQAHCAESVHAAEMRPDHGESTILSRAFVARKRT